MQYSLAIFFQELSDGSFECLSLDLESNGERISMLQEELCRRFKKDKALEKLVETQAFAFHGKSEWTRFNIMVVSFLKYCRDVNPWSLLESYDLIFNFYTDLVNCLLNDSYPIDKLVPITKEMTDYVVPVACKLDNNYELLNTRRFQFLSYVSSVVSKLFNSTKPLRNLDDHEGFVEKPHFQQLPGKQKILLYLVNKLNNIYFRIHSPQLCSNIFKNFKPKCMIYRFGEYPVQERIEFHYLLGRYYLLNNNVLNAYRQLDRSFELLSHVASTLNLSLESMQPLRSNLQRILKYLVPAGLIIGKLPRFWVVGEVDQQLAHQYAAVARAVRAGNLKGVNEWLQEHESALRRSHLLLTLLEKLPVLAYRYLVRAVVQGYTMELSSSRVPYAVVRRAVELSTGPGPGAEARLTIYNAVHSAANVEAMLVDLINLNLFRGNCFPMLETCVVRKTTDVSQVFPSVPEKVVAMFPLNGDDAWLDE
ncbi:hypothetical protein TPHA_0M00490 [Tetrapisispora phaffii CBS 4417]|uniref:Uncharacterized protein n=1 Tax=Tetrapisispora phaffii (strain ATCC 24235 / CBS 4417 / NBRC 1672 / NRRL Y-8282 / UCD 70-5) TaxID=1071381 RepID=G8C0W3_TETPH|nr:hypothetical protein TPHA_0M00490 [Tetrapisispora phaffii CBS 4417]CCE65624.1 hypothetical protein TPHA_0M00490 [Tetrapisispora phaffii CBS 4417]